MRRPCGINRLLNRWFSGTECQGEMGRSPNNPGAADGCCRTDGGNTATGHKEQNAFSKTHSDFCLEMSRPGVFKSFKTCLNCALEQLTCRGGGAAVARPAGGSAASCQERTSAAQLLSQALAGVFGATADREPPVGSRLSRVIGWVMCQKTKGPFWCFHTSIFSCVWVKKHEKVVRSGSFLQDTVVWCRTSLSAVCLFTQDEQDV